MRVPKPRTAARAASFRVEERPARASARFVTVGPDHPVWTSDGEVTRGEQARGTSDVQEEARGAFVRVRPPPDVPGDVLGAVLASLRAVARRVTGGQRPKGAVLSTAARPEAPRARPREVVLGLVAEAHTRDRAALAALCEAVMEEAGL